MIQASHHHTVEFTSFFFLSVDVFVTLSPCPPPVFCFSPVGCGVKGTMGKNEVLRRIVKKIPRKSRLQTHWSILRRKGLRNTLKIPYIRAMYNLKLREHQRARSVSNDGYSLISSFFYLPCVEVRGVYSNTQVVR